jgi:hypothetical protein
MMQELNGYTNLDVKLIHSLLVMEAERQHLPEIYVRDVFVHDYDQLRARGSKWFIWVLRTCGSHIIELDTDYPFAAPFAATYLRAIGRHADEKTLYYEYSMGCLAPRSFQQALELAAAAACLLNLK